MEIRIKTAAEFRDAHMTIEIRADQDEVQSVTNVLDQAERAGKVPALEDQVKYYLDHTEALETQVRDLRNELSGARGRVEGLEDRIRDLVAERDALLFKVEGYNHDRHTEKQRADENREWAERTEALLENAQRDLNEISSKMARVGDKVWKGTLDFAMNHRGAPEEIPIETVGDLANTVSAVRSIVGQP